MQSDIYRVGEWTGLNRAAQGDAFPEGVLIRLLQVIDQLESTRAVSRLPVSVTGWSVVTPRALKIDVGSGFMRSNRVETASSSRTRVERDDEYQRVPSRARESPHRVFW